MRIAVATLFTPEILAYAHPSLENRRRYCDRHGYTLVYRSSAADDRHPAFSKIVLLLEEINNFDWIFWSDIDALVMDGGRKIEDYVDDRFNLVVSGKHPHQPAICTGEMLIRCGDWSRRFLASVNETDTHGHPWWDQQAVIMNYQKPEFADSIKILPFGTFSSRPHTYKAGDFIVHFPARSTSDRVRLVERFQQLSSV